MYSAYVQNTRCSFQSILPFGNFLTTITEETPLDGLRPVLDDDEFLEKEPEKKDSMRDNGAARESFPHPFDLKAALMASSLLSDVDNNNHSFQAPYIDNPIQPHQSQETNIDDTMALVVTQGQQQVNGNPNVNFAAGRRFRAGLTDNGVRCMVWEIEPELNTDGTLRFKFSTAGGACLILKDDETLESVAVMADDSPPNKARFEVYSLDRSESTIVPGEQISEVIQDILESVKGKISWENGNTTATDGGEVNHTVEQGPGSRLVHAIIHRRWKNGVRRRVRAAMTGTARRKARRGRWFRIFPLILIWKLLTRRARTF